MVLLTEIVFLSKAAAGHHNSLDATESNVTAL